MNKGFDDLDKIKEAYERYDGGETNITKLAADLGVPRQTVVAWFDPARRERIERHIGIEYLYDTLKERKIDPREVSIKGARITKGDWDVTAKVKEIDPKTGKVVGQHLETTNNKRKGVEITFSPKFEEGPKWPVVDRAPAIILPKPPPIERPQVNWKCAILCSDEQIFFWRELHTEKWFAGHDERAMDIVLQVIEDFRPHRIIDGGDLIDNPEWSNKFRKFPEFAGSTQRAVNRAGLWVSQLRQVAPDAEIDEVEGNHDARMRNYIIDNARAAHGITRAYDQRTPIFRDQPSLSIPYLLRLDEHDIRYSAAFPSGDVWLNGGIVFAHENSKITREERATLFHGHDHKKHATWITVHHRGRQMRRAVVGVGTLARIDEIVDNFQRAMPTHIPASSVRHNWQQGFEIVYYDPKGGPSDFTHIPVQVIDGKARVGEKLYVARPRTIDGHLKESNRRKAA